MLTERDKPTGSTLTRSGGAPRTWSAADGALCRRAHQLGVLREHAARVARSRRGPALPAAGQLGLVDQEIQRARREVQADPVTVLDEGDRSAVGRLRRDMPDAQTGGAAGEPAVGQEQDV